MTKKQAMPYLKLYTSYLDDMDFVELDRSTRSRYWDFYLLAWQADAGGDLVNRDSRRPLTVRNMALRLRDDPTAIEHDLEALMDAGFLSRHDETWRIARYSAEQDSQESMRKSWAERQAKHRSKPREANENEPNPNEDEEEINSEEKQILTLNPSNPMKLKSHTDVTRDINRPELPEQLHPGVHALAMEWHRHIGTHLNYHTQKVIQMALIDGLDPDEIAEKIRTTAAHEPANPGSYFTQCIQALYDERRSGQ